MRLLGFIAILLAYGFGCLNGAYYIGKLQAGLDIRDHGSTNAGARNAGRVLGKSAFIYTVMFDVLKTVLPLAVALYWFHIDTWLTVSMVLAILAGHLWPIQLQFRGGKGVVVYLASALILTPFALIIAIAVTSFGLLCRRSFTVSGFIGLFTVPVVLLVLSDFTLASLFFIMLLIVAAVHRWDLN